MNKLYRESALVILAIILGVFLGNLLTHKSSKENGPGLGGVPQSTGDMAYPSFDQGVEATAKTIDDGNHNGMLAVLINPNSTAEDFAHAESFTGTSAYPGTSEWAGAAKSDPQGYYDQHWAVIIPQVKSNYNNTAALVIGTPQLELVTNTRDPSKLSNINSGGFSPSTSGDCNSANAAGAQGITQEALKLAWPEPFENKPASETGRTSALTPTPAYQAAMQQYNKTALGNYDGADCGSFVATVMIASGADPNYPHSGTGLQWSYVTSHPNKYSIQYNVTDLSQLQPGDILIVGGPNGVGGAGHTWIYVGNQPGGYYSASASEGGRSGNLTNDQLQDSNATGGYLRARLK